MTESDGARDRDLLDQAAEILCNIAGGARPLPTARVSEDWPATEKLARSLDWGQPRIGDMPAQPPTFRARIGAALVRLVRRSLFWYSDQILGFQRLVAAAAAEKIQSFARFAEGLRACEDAATALGTRVADLERKIDGASLAITRLNAAFDQSAAAGERRDEAIDELRAQTRASRQVLAQSPQELAAELSRLDRLAHESKQLALEQGLRYRVLLKELRARPGAAAGAAAARSEPDEEWLRLALAHADVFRGTPSDIRDRQSVYLPQARAAIESTRGAPALDLGCGRGEWLQLMREEGFVARGVDASLDMVRACREAGLDVEHALLLGYLRRVPNDSLSVITAFHVLEHLVWDDLLEVIDQTARVLKPGGIAVFETPNPRNLQVASYAFHLDPSHVRPIPSELLSFLVEARGLCEPEAVFLHPYPDSSRLGEEDQNAAARFINQVFFGPQDYAIIAKKS